MHSVPMNDGSPCFHTVFSKAEALRIATEAATEVIIHQYITKHSTSAEDSVKNHRKSFF